MKVYVAIPQWTSPVGSHTFGDEVDFPNDSPEEKAELGRLIEWKIVSTSPVSTEARSRKRG